MKNMNQIKLFLTLALFSTGASLLLPPKPVEGCWCYGYYYVYTKNWYLSWEIVGNHWEVWYRNRWENETHWVYYTTNKNLYYPKTQTQSILGQAPSAIQLPVTFLISSKGFWNTVQGQGLDFGNPKLRVNGAGTDHFPTTLGVKELKWLRHPSLWNVTATTDAQLITHKARIENYAGLADNLFFLHDNARADNRYTLSFERSDLEKNRAYVFFAQEEPDVSTKDVTKDLAFGCTPPTAAYLYNGNSGNQLDLMKYTVNVPAGVGRPNGGIANWSQLSAAGKPVPMFQGEYSALRGNISGVNWSVIYNPNPEILNEKGARVSYGYVAPHALPLQGYYPYKSGQSFVLPITAGTALFTPASANQTWDPTLFNKQNHLQIGDFDLKYYYRTYEAGSLDGAKVLGYNARDTYKIHNRKVYATIFDNAKPSIGVSKTNPSVWFPEAVLSGDYIPGDIGINPAGLRSKKTSGNNLFSFEVSDSNRYSWIGATINNSTVLSDLTAIENAMQGVEMKVEYYDNTPGSTGWKTYNLWSTAPFKSGLFMKSPGYLKLRQSSNYAGNNETFFSLTLANEFMPGDNVYFDIPADKTFDQRQKNATLDTNWIRVKVLANDGFDNVRDTAVDDNTWINIPVYDNDAPGLNLDFITEDRLFNAQIIEAIRDPFAKENGTIANNTAIYSYEKNGVDQTGVVARAIPGHITTPACLRAGNDEYVFTLSGKEKDGKTDQKLVVTPGGSLKIGVHAFDNFWWKTATGVVDGKSQTYTCKGTVTIKSKTSGVNYLTREFAFGSKTLAEANQEKAEIGGSYPKKDSPVTTYRKRVPQQWNGVAPVAIGFYTLTFSAIDASNNVQALSFDFEVKEGSYDKWLLENRNMRQ